jgi:hypothetical protein
MEHFELVGNHSDEMYLAVLFLATQLVDIRRKLRPSEAVLGEGCESRRGPRQDTEDLHLHCLLQSKFFLEALQEWPRLGYVPLSKQPDCVSSLLVTPPSRTLLVAGRRLSTHVLGHMYYAGGSEEVD